MNENVKKGMPEEIIKWLQGYSNEKGESIQLMGDGIWVISVPGYHGQQISSKQIADLFAMQNPDALTVADYEEILKDHRRLVKELDQIINGENATEQAALCDIVSQLKGENRKLQPVVVGLPGVWLTVSPTAEELNVGEYFATYHFAGWDMPSRGVLKVRESDMIFCSQWGTCTDFIKPWVNISGLKVILESNPVNAISNNLPDILGVIAESEQQAAERHDQFKKKGAKYSKWRERLAEFIKKSKDNGYEI